MELKEIALEIVFFVAFAVVITIPFFFFLFITVDILVLSFTLISTAIYKYFFGGRSSTDEDINEDINISIVSSNNSGRRRRLNLVEIFTHLFWIRVITITGRFFVCAIIPIEFQYRWDDPWNGKTFYIFEYSLNNPSTTAPDFAETFTRRILYNLGFTQYLSSSSDRNDVYNYPGCHDYRVSIFEKILSKSCFARQLVERYNSIEWDNIDGVPQPPPPPLLSTLDRKIFTQFFPFKYQEWVQPVNNWFDWYTIVIHQRIFPSQDYRIVRGNAKFLFFCCLHDLLAPFISWLALFGITTL